MQEDSFFLLLARHLHDRGINPTFRNSFLKRNCQINYLSEPTLSIVHIFQQFYNSNRNTKFELVIA